LSRLGQEEAFLQYWRAGGAKTPPLPDFYIGAHAEAEGLVLATRDATRYRTYFPQIEIVAPK
jgi:predicted nucleic acid-binding protein